MRARLVGLLTGLLLLLIHTVGAVETRLQLTVAGGWGLVSMDKLNERYIDGFARPSGLFTSHLSSGPQLIGEVDYFLSSRISVGFGISYLYSQTSHRTQVSVTDSFGAVIQTVYPRTKLSASMVAPQLQVQYHLSLRSAVVSFGAGITFGEGSAVISSRTEISGTDSAAIPLNYERHFSGTGVGFVPSVSARWRLASRLSLLAMAGYRFQSTETLMDDGTKWQVSDSSGRHDINLDFSGPYLVAGVTFGL